MYIINYILITYYRYLLFINRNNIRKTPTIIHNYYYYHYHYNVYFGIVIFYIILIYCRHEYI